MKLGQSLTGEQLTALAKKTIDNGYLKRALKDPIFREFARICCLFQVTAVLTPNQKQEFGHVFVIKNTTDKKSFNVQFNVSVSSMEIEAPNKES